MPRYHFHFQNGEPCVDLDGTELPDDESAQVAAVQFLGELLREKSSSFWETRALEITVSDDAGISLFVLQVSVTAPASLSAAPRASRPIRSTAHD
jgi:hypothetical protein